MRRMTARVAVMVLAMLVVAPAMAATELWQGAEKGMSPDRIRELYPEVKEPATETGGDRPTPGLVMSGYKVAGNSFDVEFYFGQQGLRRVVLQLTGDVRAVEEIPQDYKTLLEHRYGEPASYYTEPDPLPLIKAVWIDGGRDITLYWVRIRNTEAGMRIVYSTRIADEAGKL